MLTNLLARTTTLALCNVGKPAEFRSVVVGRIGNAMASLASSASKSRDEFVRLVVPHDLADGEAKKILGFLGKLPALCTKCERAGRRPRLAFVGLSRRFPMFRFGAGLGAVLENLYAFWLWRRGKWLC